MKSTQTSTRRLHPASELRARGRTNPASVGKTPGIAIAPPEPGSRMCTGRDHRIVVVGASGHQGRRYSQILHSRGRNLVGFMDPNPAVLPGLAHVPVYTDLDAVLAARDFDVALVAVPHAAHFATVTRLLGAGKYVIKEKPFAFSESEINTYMALCRRRGVGLRVISPRSYWPSIRLAQEILSELGTLHYFSYRYHLDLREPTGGWRAVHHLSLGGIILDMGYHVADVIVRLFGLPQQTSAMRAYCYPETATEKVEDVAQIHLARFPDQDLIGHVSLMRHDTCREESLEIIGSRGKLLVLPDGITQWSRSGSVEYQWALPGSHKAAEEVMLIDLLDQITETEVGEDELARQASITRLLESLYSDTPRCGGVVTCAGGRTPMMLDAQCL